MTTAREFFESSLEGAKKLQRVFHEWTKEIRERCRLQSIPLPKFAIFDSFWVFEGSDGLGLAIHQAHGDEMKRTIFGPWGQENQTGTIHYKPIDLHQISRYLNNQQWNLGKTTLMKLRWSDQVDFENLWKVHLTEIRRQQRIMEVLGTDEVARHLSKADYLLQMPNETDWGDAKSQARKALEALALSITGKTHLKGLARNLKKKGLLGGTEADWIESFEKLLGSIYGLASKKGSHKPNPTHLEAVFCVRIAKELVSYVVSLLTNGNA